MEIPKDLHDDLLDRLDRARHDKQIELELNFVTYGVTQEAFKRVITAIAAMQGVSRLAPSYILDVMPWASRTPRLSLLGQDQVQAACNSGVLDAPNMVAIEKSDVDDSPQLRIPSYGIIINSRREVHIEDPKQVADQLSPNEKQFRLKQRVSFEVGAFRVDCTAVNRNSKPVRELSSAHLMTSPTSFEIEIELVDRGPRAPDLLKGILLLATIVYRNLEGSPYVISSAVKDRAISEYLALVSKHFVKEREKTKKITPADAKADPRSFFVGPNLVALAWDNVLPASEGRLTIQQSYTVTDKADGERQLLFVASDGKCYVLNNRFHVRFTGVIVGASFAGTLLDGELIERFKLQRNHTSESTVAAFMIFDAYCFRGEFIGGLPLAANESDEVSRLAFAEEFAEAVEKSKTSKASHVQIRVKKFLYREGAEIFAAAAEILDSNVSYETDGLVFTPAFAPVGGAFTGDTPRMFGRWMQAMKWKPPHQNTIDFLVRMVGDVTIESGSTVRHARLYVGAQQMPALSPIAVLTNVNAVIRGKEDVYGEREFSDVLLPLTDEKPLCESGEVIAQNSVVEFGYAESTWKPIRIRHDKTQIYQRTGSIAGAANDINIATRIFDSLLMPVTEPMIRGAETPSYQDNTGDLYYVRNVDRSQLALRHMNNFHTLYVKGETLFNPLRQLGVATLLDLGCGRGGDLVRYANAGFKLVVGIDENEDNLLNASDGAYARLMRTRSRTDAQHGNHVVFAMWDVSQPFDGNYYTQIRNPELRDITRAVFGLVEKSQIRQGVASFYDLVRKRFDAVSAQFMVHYCFGAKESLDGLLDNVSNALNDDGIFFGTHMDGERVHDLLSKSPEGVAKGFKGGKLIWSLAKMYDDFDDEPDNNYGRKIDVYIESINKVLSEYLVDFRLLTSELAKRNIRLADPKTLAKLQIKRATGMFSDLFAELQVAKRAGKVRFAVLDDVLTNMSDEEKRLSFLNRYFIFQKVPAV
jgi:hypothetical protein